MKPKSARTLIAAAIIADLVAMMAMSPALRFGLVILAAVFAAFPAVFARKGPQVSGIVVLVLSLTVAFFVYPEYKKSMAEYVERAKQQAEKRKAVKPALTPEKTMKKAEEVAGKAETPAPVPEAAMRSGDEAVAKEAEPPSK